jgi:hypothetical protein
MRAVTCKAFEAPRLTGEPSVAGCFTARLGILPTVPWPACAGWGNSALPAWGVWARLQEALSASAG